MGEPALLRTLEKYGFHHSEIDPQAVVAGLTKRITYDMIKDTSLAIQQGIPSISLIPTPPILHLKAIFPAPELF